DAHAWVRRYLAHRLRPGAEVLSVGCGPGVILREVCALDDSIRATGMDVSAERVQEARQKNHEISQLDFVRGDAQAMELPSDRFDLVYSRMLLEYLRDKEGAVREMVRVCKRGGTVLLQDLDGQLLWHYPEDPVVQGMAEKIVKALGATGFDPFVGRKLFSFAQKAGRRAREGTKMNYRAGRDQRPRESKVRLHGGSYIGSSDDFKEGKPAMLFHRKESLGALKAAGRTVLASVVAVMLAANAGAQNQQPKLPDDPTLEDLMNQP